MAVRVTAAEAGLGKGWTRPAQIFLNNYGENIARRQACLPEAPGGRGDAQSADRGWPFPVRASAAFPALVGVFDGVLAEVPLGEHQTAGVGAEGPGVLPDRCLRSA